MSINSRWRVDPFDGTVNSILIEDEEHTIEYITELNKYGFYANEGVVLDVGAPVSLVQDNTAQTAFTEQPRTIAPNAGQFRVDYDDTDYYNTGFVQCNATDNGKAVLFTYRGTGTIVHPNFRLNTNFNIPGNSNIEGTSNFQGAATFESTSNFQGAATFDAEADIGGALNVTGAVSLAEGTAATITANNKLVEDVANPVSDQDAFTYIRAKHMAMFLPWESVLSTDIISWRGLAYGNGVFVSVSSDGATQTMRSTDGGATWSAVAAAEANTWNSVAYGNGVFVAVASTGTNRVMRSTDGGATWSAVAAAELTEWNGVTYGNGVFVAVSVAGTNRVMRSTNDGASWSGVAAAVVNEWRSVAYGGGYFVAVGSNGTYDAMFSNDGGSSWIEGAIRSDSYYGIAYGNGYFVAVGAGDTGVSDNGGQTWKNVPAADASQWRAIANDGGENFVAVATASNGVMRNFRI